MSKLSNEQPSLDQDRPPLSVEQASSDAKLVKPFDDLLTAIAHVAGLNPATVYQELGPHIDQFACAVRAESAPVDQQEVDEEVGNHCEVHHRTNYPLTVRCAWCGESIEGWSPHAHNYGYWQGEKQDWRMHEECYRVADLDGALTAGFMLYEGQRPEAELATLRVPLEQCKCTTPLLGERPGECLRCRLCNLSITPVDQPHPQETEQAAILESAAQTHAPVTEYDVAFIAALKSGAAALALLAAKDQEIALLRDECDSAKAAGQIWEAQANHQIKARDKAEAQLAQATQEISELKATREELSKAINGVMVVERASSSGQAWQPIETELPQRNKPVLVFFGKHSHKSITIAWLSDGDGFVDYESRYPDPTHWMPLPPAPAQQEEK